MLHHDDRRGMRILAGVVLLWALLLSCGGPLRAGELPSDEAGAIRYLEGKGVRITRDAEGRAVRLFSSGKPALSVEEYQLIGLLTNLEQLAINGAPLAEQQWGFLQQLPKLERLAIWHCAGFATLKPFCGLPVESLTVGGCLGLRNLNKDNPERLRDAVLTLRQLPRLRHVNLYHSPLAPDDSHLRHLAGEFPQLRDLRLDFAAPRGMDSTISPAGLAALEKLPLTVFSIENAGYFTPEHFTAIARVKTLEALLVDARRTTPPSEGLAAFRKLRPDVEVVVAEAGDPGPPRRKAGE